MNTLKSALRTTLYLAVGFAIVAVQFVVITLAVNFAPWVFVAFFLALTLFLAYLIGRGLCGSLFEPQP